MKQQKPRRDKPLLFDLRVHSRDAAIVDVKDQPMSKWYETMDVLEHKGALPEPDLKRSLVEMMEKKL